MKQFLILLILVFTSCCSSKQVVEIPLVVNLTETYNHYYIYSDLEKPGTNSIDRPVFEYLDPSYNPFGHESIIALWLDVKYTIDYEREESDMWRLPQETFEGEKGDCEDYSILLASCLINLGYDAYVALGNADGISGVINHAFVILFHENEVYVLEPTSYPYGPLEKFKLEDNTCYKFRYLINDKVCYENLRWD